MVKSLQFWAEAAGVISLKERGVFVEGPIGRRLFREGFDPYLESRDSLWLIHWQLTTRANLAAWNLVFGEGKLVRFERPKLVSALAGRGVKSSKVLAESTLEQHAAILVQSYYQSDRNNDDTSWCPLQDLGLIRAAVMEDGRVQYSTDISNPVGLSTDVFALCLIDFLVRQPGWVSDFNSVLKGNSSPGLVFRLNEFNLRLLVERAIEGPLKEGIRFVDTADTQSLVIIPEKLDSKFFLWSQDEVQVNE